MGECCSHLSEVLEDVINDDLLGLVGVHPGEGVHVDHGVLKADEREAQCSLQSLRGEDNIRSDDVERRHAVGSDSTGEMRYDMTLLIL